MLLELWHCQISRYLFPGFKTVILWSVHSKWFMSFFTKIWFVKTSKGTRGASFDEFTGLIAMKMRLQMKNRSPRYNLNRFTIIFIIFWDSLMFYQIFLSQQVKQCAIIAYKHGIYKLPNDLRLKCLNPIGWYPSV